jgi:uncharacterized protein with LGFP repeats
VTIFTRKRLFTGIVGSATVAVLALATPNAIAATYTSPQTGTHEVTGAILDDYKALGGPTGRLGYPITSELATPNGKGRYNHFQYGSIYWTATTGANQVGGAIKNTWAYLGWETSALGFPTTNELVTPSGRGRFNAFQKGAIYWGPGTGARELRGAIWSRYGALGWERSPLGFPLTNELGTPNGKGRYNHFQAGSIYWSATTGAHSVMGAIRDRWAFTGWETSWLGFPTTDEFPVPGGRAQDFQCGSIGWTPRGGTVVVRSAACGGGPAAGPNLTVSQQNAQKSAKSYLDFMSFSRVGLIDQLVFEGFSIGDATWAVDSLNVNWREEAVQSARSYLNSGSFSRSGLIEQLEFEDFATGDAIWAVDSVNANWNEEAAQSAKSYLRFSSFSRSGLISQLVFEGFTPQQAEYGVNQTGL